MKRIHIGLDVTDLEKSVAFYTTMLGAEPTVLKADYAKWSIEDPPVNLSLTSACCKADVHFGIEVDSASAVDQMSGRLSEAGQRVLEERSTTCCYHHSDKTWALDPDDFRWETFHTTSEAAEFGHSSEALEEMRSGRVANPG